jgi:hypothetical protein
MMIGSGIPISHINAPFPKVMSHPPVIQPGAITVSLANCSALVPWFEQLIRMPS